MRRFLSLALLGAALLPAASLSSKDRDVLVDHLEDTRRTFLAAVDGLTPEQLAFKPAPDRWSVMECAEHIALTEDFLFGYITRQLMAAPVDPAKRAEVKRTDAEVLAQIGDRSQKSQAPEPAKPTGKFADLAAAIAHFNASRGRTLAYVKTTQDDLRAHVGPVSPVGRMDAYQYMLLLSAHVNRHVKQMDEVKASPGYPKK